MANLGLNVLFDSYVNVEAAERSLYPYLDRTPNDAIQITAAARAEQGHAFALRLRARYPAMEVVFRLGNDDFIHQWARTPKAWVDSFAPWAADGELTLSVNNEPGAELGAGGESKPGDDLAFQDDWMAGIGRLLHALGIRAVFWNLQTHNRFDPARLDATIAMCAELGMRLGLHYYFDITNGFAIDPLHEPIEAYRAAKGYARFPIFITELGYAERLASRAGYHGRLAGAGYGAQLAAVGRLYPALKCLIYGWGAQAPWGDFDVSEDKDVQDAIVAANAADYPAGVLPNGTNPAPKQIAHKSGLYLRDAPGGLSLGVMAYGERVTVYAEPMVSAGLYQWQRVTRAGGVSGWGANRVNGVESFADPVSQPGLRLGPVASCAVVISSRFGAPRDYGPHEGLDLAPAHANCQPAVLAGAAGVVAEVKAGGAYGKRVVIEHRVSGEVFRTWYCHLAALLVEEGEVVTAGQVVGLMGTTGNSTGVHLHLNLQWIGHGQGGYVVDDVIDPAPYLA